MPLINVNEVRVKPERSRLYQKLVDRFAKQAREKDDPWKWDAYETVIGPAGTFHFVSQCENFQELGTLGSVADLILRVSGAQEGERILEEAGQSILEEQRLVATDRPELSYPNEPAQQTSAGALVTVVRARPGQQEAVEELIRKIAEAIPKVGDSARLTTFQILIGDMAEYRAVRPFDDLGAIDQQATVPDLLNQAFGAAEGGLIYRSGLDAIEKLERSAIFYREDMSNSPER